jgi:SAM-dependent methyltransferase
VTTLQYYDRNADAFHERTRTIDMMPPMKAFLDLLPAGAEILDVGCGPGRDLRTFAELGYRATGIDGSRAMVKLAASNTGLAIQHIAFSQIEYVEAFDGIWANASLLHVPDSEIDDVMNRLVRALRAGGALFMSVKAGHGARTSEDGRFFNDYSDQSLRGLFSRHPEWELLNIEQSQAGPKQLDQNPWLHALALKHGTRRIERRHPCRC